MLWLIVIVFSLVLVDGHNLGNSQRSAWHHGIPWGTCFTFEATFSGGVLGACECMGNLLIKKTRCISFPIFLSKHEKLKIVVEQNYIFPAIKWIWIHGPMVFTWFHMISKVSSLFFICVSSPTGETLICSIQSRPPAGNSMLWHLRHRLRPQQSHRGHQQRMIRISIALRLPFSEAMYSGYLWLWCVGKTRIAMEKREKYWKLISQLATTSHCAVPARWFFHCPNVYLWLLVNQRAAQLFRMLGQKGNSCILSDKTIVFTTETYWKAHQFAWHVCMPKGDAASDFQWFRA